METTIMDNVVDLRPTHPEDFWLYLEVSIEFLRDDGSSDLLRTLMRDEHVRDGGYYWRLVEEEKS
jgi:hypothetical protein